MDFNVAQQTHSIVLAEEQHTIHLGLAPEKLASTNPSGELRIATKVAVDSSGKYSLQYFKESCDPLHILEAKSAIYWHKTFVTSGRHPDDIGSEIRAVEISTGNHYLKDDFAYLGPESDLDLIGALTMLFDQTVLTLSRELNLDDSFYTWLSKSAVAHPKLPFFWMNHLKTGLRLKAALIEDRLPAWIASNITCDVGWRTAKPNEPA